ncbi:MAG: nitrogen regulation protein NR(II), partial [Candidatus Hodarchaeota archaeon]
KLRLIAENADEMIAILNDNFEIEYFNDLAFFKKLDYTKDDIYEKGFQLIIHPDDLINFKKLLEKNEGELEASMVFRMQRKDTMYIWVEVTRKVISLKERERKNLVIFRDISERKMFEESLIRLNEKLELRVKQRTKALQDAQERIIYQEKLATIGKIAGSIAHELRNPLFVINNSIYYLNKKLTNSNQKIRKHLDIIQEELKKSTDIISSLFNYWNEQPHSFQEANINDIINLLLEDTQIPNNIRLKKNLDADLLIINVNKIQIQLAFRNIIANALQAMPQGGNLEIGTVRMKNIVEIEFKDTGRGMEKKNLQKIFDPLFTTKTKGIGLGLTIVKDIVENHKGTIEVESQVGIGTTFLIRLPMKKDGDDLQNTEKKEYNKRQLSWN